MNAADLIAFLVPNCNPLVTDLERAPRESPDVREKRNKYK